MSWTDEIRERCEAAQRAGSLFMSSAHMPVEMIIELLDALEAETKRAEEAEKKITEDSILLFVQDMKFLKDEHDRWKARAAALEDALKGHMYGMRALYIRNMPCGIRCL